MAIGKLMNPPRQLFGNMKDKRVVSVPFGEREELNAFLNQHHLKKEDIINIDYHWNLGLYNYILTCYATPDLFPAINKRIELDRKENNKAVLISLAVVFMLFLAVGIYSLLR